MKTITAVATCLASTSLLLYSGLAGSTDTHSAQHRLIASGTASVSAVAGSPTYEIYLVGGAGQPVGISASPSSSMVTGGASNLLPTERIFRDGMEGE